MHLADSIRCLALYNILEHFERLLSTTCMFPAGVFFFLFTASIFSFLIIHWTHFPRSPNYIRRQVEWSSLPESGHGLEWLVTGGSNGYNDWHHCLILEKEADSFFIRRAGFRHPRRFLFS